MNDIWEQQNVFTTYSSFNWIVCRDITVCFFQIIILKCSLCYSVSLHEFHRLTNTCVFCSARIHSVSTTTTWWHPCCWIPSPWLRTVSLCACRLVHKCRADSEWGSLDWYPSEINRWLQRKVLITLGYIQCLALTEEKNQRELDLEHHLPLVLQFKAPPIKS